MPRAEISPEQKRRLADALRANLARRKQQLRARRAPTPLEPVQFPEAEGAPTAGTPRRD